MIQLRQQQYRQVDNQTGDHREYFFNYVLII